jgi:hypothetical protein
MACWGASSLPSASDSGAAVLAIEVLHATLAELLKEQLADSAAVRTAVRSEAALAAAGAKMSAIVLDDSTELTGQEAMVRAGARNLGRRVARAVRAGGVATNFPTP